MGLREYSLFWGRPQPNNIDGRECWKCVLSLPRHYAEKPRWVTDGMTRIWFQVNWISSGLSHLWCGNRHFGPFGLFGIWICIEGNAQGFCISTVCIQGVIQTVILVGTNLFKMVRLTFPRLNSFATSTISDYLSYHSSLNKVKISKECLELWDSVGLNLIKKKKIDYRSS